MIIIQYWPHISHFWILQNSDEKLTEVFENRLVHSFWFLKLKKKYCLTCKGQVMNNRLPFFSLPILPEAVSNWSTKPGRPWICSCICDIAVLLLSQWADSITTSPSRAWETGRGAYWSLPQFTSTTVVLTALCASWEMHALQKGDHKDFFQ